MSVYKIRGSMIAGRKKCMFKKTEEPKHPEVAYNDGIFREIHEDSMGNIYSVTYHNDSASWITFTDNSELPMAGNTLVKIAIILGIGLLLAEVLIDIMLQELNLIFLSFGIAGIILGLALILDEKDDEEDEKLE